VKIRHATPDDLDGLSRIENICFPQNEAAPRDCQRDRLYVFPNHFWVMENDAGEVIGYANGMVVNQQTFSDEWFSDADLHDENGDWQTVFGLTMLPEYQRRGYAGRLMEALIAAAREENRKGCILTCKEHLVPYYEKFGYIKTGISPSKLGGATWYDMVLTF